MKDFLKKWWRVILWAIVIAVFSTILPAQNSGLHLCASHQFGNNTLGVAGQIEDSKFMFKTAILANNKNIVGNIEAKYTLGRDGRSRLMLGPKLTSNVRTNEFGVSISPEWNWRSNKVQVSIGADVRFQKQKSYLKTPEVGNIEYNDVVPVITPSVSVSYLMYGKAYRPSPTPKKKRQKIQHGLTWWDGGALLGAVVSGVSRGTINALRKDPGSLQRYLGVGDYDWGGAQDWQRNYEGNRYINAQTGLPNPHKTEILGNFGRDAWHTADEGTKWGDRIGAACFIVGSAIQVHIVSKVEYKSNTTKKKAIRKKVLQCAIKGAALWAISSKLEQGTFDTITIAK